MINCFQVLLSISTCAATRRPVAREGRPPNLDGVGRCRLNPIEPRVESAWLQRLKLNCDEQVSSFAFNFNLRRYNGGERPVRHHRRRVGWHPQPNCRRRALGRAVQVAPIRPTLKAPRTKRLKLKCDILLSTAAFKSNLRRYIWVDINYHSGGSAERFWIGLSDITTVRRCRLNR